MQFFSILCTLFITLACIYSYLHLSQNMDFLLYYEFFLFSSFFVEKVLPSVTNFIFKIQWKYYYVYLYLILFTPYMVYYVLNSRQDSFLYRFCLILSNNIVVRRLFTLPFEKVVTPPAASEPDENDDDDGDNDNNDDDGDNDDNDDNDDNNDHMPFNRSIFPRDPVVAGPAVHVGRLVFGTPPGPPTAEATTATASEEYIIEEPVDEEPIPEGMANLEFLRPRTFPTGRFFESLDIINGWIESNDHMKLTIFNPGLNNYFETEPVALSKSLLLELFTVDRTKRLKDLLRYMNDPESPEETTFRLATALTFFILKALNMRDDIETREDSVFQFIQPLFVNTLRTNRDPFVCDFILYQITLDFPTADLVLENDVDRNGINWMILQEEPELYHVMEEFKKNDFMKPHPPSSSSSSSSKSSVFDRTKKAFMHRDDDDSERENLIQDTLANVYMNAMLNELAEISEILGDQTRKMYSSLTMSPQGDAHHLILVPRSDLTTEELIAMVLPNITPDTPEEPTTGEEATGSAAAAATTALGEEAATTPTPARNNFFYGLTNDVDSAETGSEFLGTVSVHPLDFDRRRNVVLNQGQTNELSDNLEFDHEMQSFELSEFEEEYVTSQGQQSATTSSPFEVQNPQSTEANREFDTVSKDWNSLRYEPSDADDLDDLLYGAIPASFEDIVPEMRLTEAEVIRRLEKLFNDPVIKWLNNLYPSSVRERTSTVITNKLKRIRNTFLMVMLSIKTYHKHVIQYEKGYTLKQLIKVMKMYVEELKSANQWNIDCIERYPATWTGFKSTKPLVIDATRAVWNLKHVYDRFSLFDLSYQKKLYKENVYAAYRDIFRLCNASRDFEEGMRRGDNI